MMRPQNLSKSTRISPEPASDGGPDDDLSIRRRQQFLVVTTYRVAGAGDEGAA